MEIKRRHENPICRYTLYVNEFGKEVWHCFFKFDDHPVNKKLFKMSGAVPDDEQVIAAESDTEEGECE